jgi:glyceraldehyde-3-phosphate dehydrogenase (NADP+)
METLFPRAEEIPEPHRQPPVHRRRFLVGGEIRSWEGESTEVLSPVCLREGSGTLRQAAIGSHPAQGEREALEALGAATTAWSSGRGEWPTLPVAERIRRTRDFLVRMKARRGPISRLLMWEIGKTLGDSEKEFDRTIRYVEDTLEALRELDHTGARFQEEAGIFAQIRRAPLGVVLCMGPFNYPLNETFTTLLPALVMGNVVVVKPPRFGVLLFDELLEPFRDSFPPGTVNTVDGDGRAVVGPLMTDGRIDVLAFIGTSRVGNLLKHQHPRAHRLRSVLGLDAKNPAIVLADADLDLAVRECVTGALTFNGQRCTGLKLLFVHRSVAGPFVERLVAAVGRLRLGMPWEEGVEITPLPEPGKPAWLNELVRDAVAKGARLENVDGGESAGTLFRPAVVSGLTREMRLWTEEQFGPVVPVAVFDDISDPIRAIVESPFGQQVSIFGNDPAAIGSLVDPLINQVCRINLNSQCQRGPDTFPFGGRKDSAEGTLSVTDALRVFSIRTLVAANGTERNKELVTRILRERRSSWLSTDFVL